jgi:hypothetical protein
MSERRPPLTAFNVGAVMGEAAPCTRCVLVRCRSVLNTALWDDVRGDAGLLAARERTLRTRIAEITAVVDTLPAGCPHCRAAAQPTSREGTRAP